MNKSFYDAFPAVLATDTSKAALGKAIAEQLHILCQKTDKLSIFPSCDSLPEGLLDILAKDLQCDWYDYDAPLEEKRATIKSCFAVHRYKGTKYAVETALNAVFPKAEVSEWFEYGGEPYHFKVKIYASTNDQEKLSLVPQKVNYYKNLRSVLDYTTFQIAIDGTAPFYTGIALSSYHVKIYAPVINPMI